MLAMLNPKTSELDFTAFDTSPKYFSQQDVTLLLHGLSNYQDCLLRAKYAQDFTCRITASEIFQAKAKQDNTVQDWLDCDRCSEESKDFRYLHFGRLCQFVMDRYMEERKCRHCNGTGYISQAHTDSAKCTKCDNGSFEYNKSVISRATGLKRQTISNYQNTILKDLWTLVLRHEMDAVERVNANRHRVFGEEEMA